MMANAINADGDRQQPASLDRALPPMNVTLRLIVLLSLLLLVNRAYAADDDISLHERIDQLVESTPGYDQHASAVASDAEFLRRLYLDLTGRIPSVEQAREFLADAAEGKRVALIDRLLASPEHARHLQHQFDVMLMQRRPEKHVKFDPWRAYLFQSMRDNKSWEELTREMLSADGADTQHRAPARFLLDRELKSDETTRDLGRVFLGRDLQCAQCHDHPHIGDYAQQHYFGISAFLNRSYLFTDPKTKQVSIGEKAEGTVKFTSVFTSEESETPPRILDLTAFADPTSEEDPYIAKPEKDSRGIPKHSRRMLLADAVTDPANRAYRLNIANRLWAMIMGRGLVEPLDMFHSGNPPSHPELLDLLADDLAAHGYDMRRTIRELVSSRTYQRSSQLAAGGAAEPQRYDSALLKPLSPEQLAWSMMQATGVVAGTRAGVIAKLQNEQPDGGRGSEDYEFVVEQRVNDELQQHVDTFVTVFASSNESSRFDATAKQALFLMNGPLLGQWLQDAEPGLIARLEDQASQRMAAEQLYLAVLTRFPTESEAVALKQFVNSCGADRVSGLRQATRAILCSAEFRFNH